MNLSWVGMLAAIARLLSAMLAAVRDDRRKLQSERNIQTAHKAATHDHLLTALRARRDAQKQWRKAHGAPMADGADSDRNRSDG